jgi:DNA-binding XRE family transcriptional regulator
MSAIKIDPEFKMLIPPLSDEEYEQLEANLKAEGCRDPLVTWEGTIIDGHNRFEICTVNGIAFEKINKRFADRSEVIEWIIRNQFGRRNLDNYQRTKLALRLEDAIAARAKANQSKFTGNQHVGVPQKSAEVHIETREEIAKLAGVSRDTVDKVKQIEKDAPKEIKDLLSKGQISINKAHQSVKKKTKPQDQKPRKSKKSAIPTVDEIKKDHQRILGNLKSSWAAAPKAIREEFLAWVEKTKNSTCD